MRRQNQRQSRPSRKSAPLIKKQFRPATTGVALSLERPFEKNPNIVRSTRWISSNAFPSTSAESPTPFNFKLNQLPGYTEMTNMFDQYRITRVDVLYEPASRAGSSAATGSSGAPVMWTQVDYDSTSTVSIAQLAERENTMIHSAFDRWEHSFIPKIASAAYQSAVASGYYIENGNPWISTSTPGVEYYGFKFSFPQVTSTTQFGGTLFFRVHVELKNVL